MASSSSDAGATRVAVVGGGIAAVETTLALHHLADARLRVTVIAPHPDFLLAPMAVAVPFNRGHVDRVSLAQLMDEYGGRLVVGTAVRVDPDARTVTLSDGQQVDYDVLVLAHGAAAVPAFEHALTFGADPHAMTNVLARLERSSAGSIAFVVPAGCTWPLPLYELALMTARDLWAMNADPVDVHFVTPEAAPLEIFGSDASAAVAQLLQDARITLHRGVSAQIAVAGRVETGDGGAIVVDEVVALPVYRGREIDGIPATADGFIRVDDSGLIDGLEGVYAVGDATDRPIKQGGLACQQADVAAAHIAAAAGARIEVPALQQVLRGRLLTGTSDRFLRRAPGEPDGSVSEQPLSWSPAKVAGRYLAPYLVAKGLVHLPPRAATAAPGIEVQVHLTWQQRRGSEALGLSPLGPMTWAP